jgi:hypothetical protein
MGIIDRMGGTFTFRRFAAGQYVNGKWIDGVEVIPTDEDGNEISWSMAASIQRMTAQETQAMPEGQRSSEWIKIYTTTKLERTQEADKTKGDVVSYNDREYEVIKIEDWMDTRIPHYKALAVLIEN